MEEIAAVVKDISHSIAPPDALGAAIDILQQHHELTTIQRLDIGEYLALEKKKTRIKQYFSTSSVKKSRKNGCHAGCLRLWRADIAPLI